MISIRINHITFSLFILGMICHGHAQNNDHPSIYGKLVLDSIWEPTVYLSHIPTFQDMNTMSNEMIIAQSDLDSLGQFSFSADFFPEEDQLYRLHLSKKDAPAAFLIIGGTEENHMFLIANNQTVLRIENKYPNELFREVSVSGYAPNIGFQTIKSIVTELDSASVDSGGVSIEFLTRATHEELRQVADTSSHPLVSLYALHHSKFETTFLTHRVFYQDYLKRWENEDSSYFQALRSRLPKVESKTPFGWYVILGLGLFGLGFGLNYLTKNRNKQVTNQLRTLSVQERKIFQLIQSGKSNKEISEAHNIGVSTVKSHVGNIYSKLNIKSRKEAMDYK